METIKYEYFKPEKAGIRIEENRVMFSHVCRTEGECGIILYKKDTKESSRFPFSKKGKCGQLYGITLFIVKKDEYLYNYYENDSLIIDQYARGIAGTENWGKPEKQLYGCLIAHQEEWEEEPLKIPYEDSIIYALQVRGFTADKSSKVKNKGTFEGIVEKIPYLKELGITAVELMPAYEYTENKEETDLVSQTMQEAIDTSHEDHTEQKEPLLNLWGYTQGYYYAPKASFSAIKNPVVSFKRMVQELHLNGIEVIMQFYFPATVTRSSILDILKYWVYYYHIDGIHLMGENLPVNMIAEDAFLTDTKLLYYGFPYEELYKDMPPIYRNLASCTEEYRTNIRRFMKSDDGMLGEFVKLNCENDATHGTIHYINYYDGLSLLDMVSYDKKHNEANGEDNKDGTDYNYSWNCGIEGPTRKRAIVQLRLKQMRNALTLLFLSQGTPLIFSGDEMANTREGNNNVYCQDNVTGWVNWKMNETGKQILEYIRFLIAFRKEHAVFRQKTALRMLDYMSSGYPDVSFHGKEAWRPDLSYGSRSIGFLYDSRYCVQEAEEEFLYIAYNMHWMTQELALPKLPGGFVWKKRYSTNEEQLELEAEQTVTSCSIGGRTITIYQSEKLPELLKRKKKTDKRGIKQNETLSTF